VRAGVAYDNSPARDVTRTPRIPDSDRYWLSVGASYQVLRNVGADRGLHAHLRRRREGGGCGDRGPGTENFLRGNLDANYSASVDIVAVQARLMF
jgi:long-chain fatty acid transport protein